MTPSERRWLELARRVLPPEDRGWLGAELEALHRDRVERLGRRRALGRLRREVLGFATVRVGRPIRRNLREGGARMGDVWREIRLTVRSLARSQGFALVALASLALGIGANALVFSLVDGVILRPLPYPEPDRIVWIWNDATLPAAEVDYARENAGTLDEVAAWLSGVGVNLQTVNGPVRLTGIQTTPSLLEILGNPLALGPGFSPDVVGTGREDEVILSHRTWTEHFGADPGILGSRVELDDVPRTVVGVLRRGESFPSARQDFLLPLTLDDANLGGFWGFYNLQAIGRLSPGATPEQATEELRAFAGGPLTRDNPIWTPVENYRAENQVVPLATSLSSAVEERLYLLLGAVFIVLLVVAANVGNLLLNRGLSRRGEMAVRAALGAGRGQLIRQHLLEGLLLAAGGTAAGLALALAGLAGLRPILLELLPRAGQLQVDGRVMFATGLVALMAGLASGGVAAIRGVERNPAALVGSGTRAGTSGRRLRLARGLVVAQVAASVVLLVSAGLLLRSLGALRGMDPGFRADELITAQLDFSPTRYSSVEERGAVLDLLQVELDREPGLASAAVAGSLPFAGNPENSANWLDGISDNPNALPFFQGYRVTPGYFETMEIELVQGRLFTDADNADGEPVALVDRTAVREEFGQQDPVGRTIRLFGPNGPGYRIVGVVETVRNDPITQDPPSTWYRPLPQALSGTSVRVVVKPRGGPAEAYRALEQVVQRVDPTAAVSRAWSYPRLIADGWRDTRFLMSVLAFFALVTLLLGTLGVYGVSAYMVRRRVREFGVKLALGARPAGIRREVLLDGARLGITGAVVGLALAVPTARLLQRFLVGVGPLDALAFLGVPVILALATLLAVYLPARRATRVDPATVLQEQ